MLDGLPYAIIDTTDGGTCVVDPDPNVIGGRAFSIGPPDLTIALPNVVTGTVGVVSRYWLNNLPLSDTTSPDTFILSTVSSVVIIAMRTRTNGSIQIRGRVAGVLTVVADSINPILQPSSWNNIELKFNTSTGVGSLYVNGVSRLTWTGVDTGNTVALVSFRRTSIGTNGPGPDAFLKQLVIWDGTGSENNDTLGNVTVLRHKTTADVTLGGWLPSVGATGFNLLAKNAPNDTTYLSGEDVPLPAAMEFEFEDLPPDVTSVLALIMVSRHRKTDGGDGNVQTALSPNGVDWDNGADRPITTAFQYDFDVSELSPATSSQWTPLEVDALKGRVNRTL
jgi:hypothetical protein